MLHLRAIKEVITVCGLLWALADTNTMITSFQRPLVLVTSPAEHITKVGCLAPGRKHLEADIASHGLGSTNIAVHPAGTYRSLKPMSCTLQKELLRGWISKMACALPGRTRGSVLGKPI